MKNSIEIEIPEMGKIKFESLRDTNKKSNNIPIKNSKYIFDFYKFLKLKLATITRATTASAVATAS